MLIPTFATFPFRAADPAYLHDKNRSYDPNTSGFDLSIPPIYLPHKEVTAIFTQVAINFIQAVKTQSDEYWM